jgi:hypothetical protein
MKKEKKKESFYSEKEIAYITALAEEVSEGEGYVLMGVKMPDGGIRGTVGVHSIAKADVLNSVISALDMGPAEVLAILMSTISND